MQSLENAHFWKVTDIETDNQNVWCVWVALCSVVPPSKWITTGDGKQERTLDGACFPTVRRVAELARCSDSSVRRALRVLEETGYITSSPTYSAVDGAQRSNRYTLFPKGDALKYVSREARLYSKRRKKGNLRLFPLPLPFPEEEELLEN